VIKHFYKKRQKGNHDAKRKPRSKKEKGGKNPHKPKPEEQEGMPQH
jgi:hypothetical protein